MLGSDFNIEEIRNLNKIRIYGVMPRDAETHKEKGVSKIFEAYLTSPLGEFKTGVSTADSLAKQMGEFLQKHSTMIGWASGLAKEGLGGWLANKENAGIVNTLGTAFDLANDINYNYHYRYTDTSEFSHTFQTELVVKDDFIEDVIQPLWTLLSYVLPTESDTAGSTAVYQSLEYGVQAFYDFICESMNNLVNDYIKSDTLAKFANAALQTGEKKLARVGQNVNDVASSVSKMYKPSQLNGTYSHTRILIGDYITIDDVIITDVNFNVPYLFYEGGLFDKLTVNITVKGNRKMTTKTYDWLRRLHYLNADRSLSEGHDSLNSYYESSTYDKKLK